MPKIKPLKFVLWLFISFAFIFLFSHLPLSSLLSNHISTIFAAGTPNPAPYVPCNDTRSDEFHSLRPYQASPCDTEKKDLAYFCGNDIYIGDTVTISKIFSTPDTSEYYNDGTRVYPNLPVQNLSPNLCVYCSSEVPGLCKSNPNLPCIPEDICETTWPSDSIDLNNCGHCELINDNKQERCAFTIENQNLKVAIDVSGAEYPIMGYTEPSEGNENIEYKVINSVNDGEGSENVDNPTKMNEYVSWYLNGVTGRAEYPYLNPAINCVGESTGKSGTCMNIKVNNDGSLMCLGNPLIPFTSPPEEPSYIADGKRGCTGTNTFCCVSKELTTDPENTPSTITTVNYSGPIKKLLPFTIQNIERINQINDASASVNSDAKIRHDQVIACHSNILATILGLGDIPNWLTPLKCYGDKLWGIPINWTKTKLMLTGYVGKTPPIEEDPNYLGEDYNKWVADYKSWRGYTCLTLPIYVPIINEGISVNLCFDNPLKPNILGNLFSYVPFSSTEDRVGDINIKKTGYSYVQYSPFVRILYSRIYNIKNSDMFVPHMLEDTQLAQILQNTYTYKDADQTTMENSSFIPSSPYCAYREYRANPGDDLFSTELGASIDYAAQMTCTFWNWGGGTQGAPIGNLCENQLGGECVQAADERWLYIGIDNNYGEFDCGTGKYCVTNNDWRTIMNDGGSIGCQGMDPITHRYVGCFPNNFIMPDGSSCPEPYIHGECPQPGYFSCSYLNNNCNRPASIPSPPQQCTYPIMANIKLETRTPLADEAWARLVAGSAGIFRKMFPKIGGVDSNFEGIIDMPTATDVEYINLDGGTLYVGNPYNQDTTGQLYFPHIGGIKEYFLKGVQTLLRPKGFGQQIVFGIPDDGTYTPPGGGGVGDCKYDDAEISAAVNYAAGKYGIPESMLRAIFEIEALEWIADPNGYVCERNYASAMGLTQVTDGTYNTVTCSSERYSDDTGICDHVDGKLSRCNVQDSFELAARVLLSKVGAMSGCNQVGSFPTDARYQYQPVCDYYSYCHPDSLTTAYSYNLPSGQCANQNYCDIVFNKMGRGSCHYNYPCN